MWAAVVLASASGACGGSGGASGSTRIADMAIDPKVVEVVAQRDDLSPERAERHVTRVLRLVADAREREVPQAELSPEREAHLRRNARARLWIDTVFEAQHTPSDIPSSLVATKRNDPRFSRPRLHRLCQVVAIPDAASPSSEEATDPRWRMRAHERMEAITEHFEPYLRDDAPRTCTQLERLLQFEARTEDGVRIKLEDGAFDLDACADEHKHENEGCERSQWDATWVAAVRDAAPGRFIAPFETQLGVHWVYLDAILEPREPDDPDVEREIREWLHPRWQREAFTETLENLRADAAVAIAGATP